MTPFVQSVLILILSAIVIPTLSWLVAKILVNEKEVVKIRAELTAMQQRCGEHRQWLMELSQTIQRLDRTTTAIATKLDVKLEERQMK